MQINCQPISPYFVIKFDTSFADIEVLEQPFTGLAYPKHGITAVIFFAEDLYASIHRSAFQLSFAGDEH